MNSFAPYWPENLLVIGAGATVELGMETSEDLGEAVFELASANNENFRNKVFEMFKGLTYGEQNKLYKLFKHVDISAQNKSDSFSNKKSSFFSDKRIERLREVYDWHSLKQVIKRCPGFAEGKIQVQDIYNLIDMHLETGHGLRVDGYMVQPERLIAARNMMNMLTALRHAVGFRNMVQNNGKVYEQYYQFALELGKMMQQEGLERLVKHSLSSREFYLFSYSIISMNWDPIFLWLIFNAHKELNDRPPYIGSIATPMKLFNDLAHFMAVREIESPESGKENLQPGAWFPMNETAVQRLNDSEHQTGRRVRIGKFYFPHGCHGFRECPNCGKLTFYLGNEWNINSESLFPPPIISDFLFDSPPRSKEEFDAHESDMSDAIQCVHCGTITEQHHSAIIMQTNFKGSHPPYIEEIQRDMKVAIEKANHVILFGYSFPDDDFIYRSIFAARRQMGESPLKCSIVNYDPNAEDRWMYKDDMEKFKGKYKGELSNLYSRVVNLFGEDNIRVYGQGIPNVFLRDDKVDGQKIQELLNWD